jgi:hypothetical protein
VLAHHLASSLVVLIKARLGSNTEEYPPHIRPQQECLQIYFGLRYKVLINRLAVLRENFYAPLTNGHMIDFKPTHRFSKRLC